MERQKIDVWCSNDYLSMSQNEDVMSAMKNAVDQLGAGSGGTRNISGTTRFHVELEERIANFMVRELWRSTLATAQMTLL